MVDTNKLNTKTPWSPQFLRVKMDTEIKSLSTTGVR